MIYSADVAVIGAGHAGVEAALAAARLGADTVIFTINPDAVANMPCNPSIGGSGKGHLVYELDALGGEMGYSADLVTLQSRTLNLGKGAAVRSKRIQADRNLYRRIMKHTLELQKNLRLVGAEVVDFGVETDCNGVRRITSVTTRYGDVWRVRAAVIAAGTYLDGKVFVGEASFSSGPDGMLPAKGLTEALVREGFSMRRFKTGTPPRILRSSIDFTRLEIQPGEDVIVPFSCRTDPHAFDSLAQIPCHIVYTNENTHNVIRANLGRSPLYSGKIHGTGPRYCPSIEDKVVRFASKERHQLFLEPLGPDTEEMYLGGFSSSLPSDVQYEMLRTLPGFEAAEIIRYAYAIEYDCIDPLSLYSTLETKAVRGLFGAGQFNGTSGYEEAAVQGILAGINAARYVSGREGITLPRRSSYIGTLIDDLVTKGTEEPYRIMTSRSEFRLLLRQDNADARLCDIGHEVGLLPDDLYEAYLEKQARIEEEKRRAEKTVIPPSPGLAAYMEERGTAPVKTGITLADLLRRPQLDYPSTAKFDPARPKLSASEELTVETDIKYEGYIRRQRAEVASAARLESKLLPTDTDYTEIGGLRIEAAQKLNKFRPKDIGQASRISGVNPADISVLLIWLSRHPVYPTGRREKSCGCLVFALDGETPEVLMIESRRNGDISFPKGHMEEGESERQTAERELAEETGVSLRITAPFRHSISYMLPGGVRKESVFFAAVSPRTEPVPQEEEVSRVFWAPVSEASEILTHDSEKDLLSRALAFISGRHEG